MVFKPTLEYENMVKAYRDKSKSNQGANQDEKYRVLSVTAHADFDYVKLESEIHLKHISVTSDVDKVIIAFCAKTEQDIDELLSKMKTEPYKSGIMKITDETTVLYDASRRMICGVPILDGKRQCIRIFREKSRILREHSGINPTVERGEEVLHWSSLLTAESRYNENLCNKEAEEKEYKDYYLTEAGRELHFDLTRMPAGEIVGLVGLQGVGKTSMLKKMAHDLNSKETPVFFIHWTPDWFEKLKQNPEIKQTYKDLIVDALSNKVESYGRTFRRMAALGGKIPNLDDIARIGDGRMLLETMEEALTKGECKKAMEDAMNETLPYVRYLFIDLPDYDKQGKSTRNLDLQSIETIWKRAFETAGSDMNVTFVLGIQQETYGGHFLYGKMHIVHLKPMKKEEMIQAYKHKWKTTEPFTEESLGLIADLSGGIFRRFLRYIAMTVKTACRGGVFPITIDAVNASITFSVLAEDMAQELAKMFKGDEEQKTRVVKLLTLLRQKPSLNQKEIAEALEVSEDVMGVMLKKLELYSYIRYEHGERRERKWFIA